MVLLPASSSQAPQADARSVGPLRPGSRRPNWLLACHNPTGIQAGKGRHASLFRDFQRSTRRSPRGLRDCLRVIRSPKPSHVATEVVPAGSKELVPRFWLLAPHFRQSALSPFAPRLPPFPPSGAHPDMSSNLVPFGHGHRTVGIGPAQVSRTLIGHDSTCEAVLTGCGPCPLPHSVPLCRPAARPAPAEFPAALGPGRLLP